MQHHGLQNQIFVPDNNMDLFIIYQNKINSKATHAQLLNITIRDKICSAVIDSNYLTATGIRNSKEQIDRFILDFTNCMWKFYDQDYQYDPDQTKIQHWDQRQKGPNCVTTTSLKLWRKLWLLKNNLQEQDYPLTWRQSETWRHFLSCHVQLVC